MIPMVSIIIPVLHEKLGINNLINHLYNQSGVKDLKIIIIVADPQKGTINALRKRKGVIPVVSEKGRGRQMNVGAEIASGKSNNIVLMRSKMMEKIIF